MSELLHAAIYFALIAIVGDIFESAEHTKLHLCVVPSLTSLFQDIFSHNSTSATHFRALKRAGVLKHGYKL